MRGFTYEIKHKEVFYENMNNESQQNENVKETQHKIDNIFSQHYDFIWVNAKTRERTALIASKIQRDFGKNRVFFSYPYFNTKIGLWTLKISIDLPQEMVHSFLKYPDALSDSKDSETGET